MLPTVKPLGAGLDHSAYLLNDELVVRFRREPTAADQVAAEARLLTFVGAISPVPVPRPVFVDARRGCMAYPRLPGKPLISAGRSPVPTGPGRGAVGPGRGAAGPERGAVGSGGGAVGSGRGGAGSGRGAVGSQGGAVGSGRGQAGSGVGVAARLGQLLAVLHAVPPERVADFAEVDDTPPAEWLADAAQLWPAVSGHVPTAYHPAVETFLAAPPPAPASTLVFSHQDLGIEHVLVGPDPGTVTGVIDWSDAAIGDPARDFGLILRDLGADALAAALRRDDPELVRRSEFYARCGLITDLAYGVGTGWSEYADKSLTGLTWLFTD